MDQSGNQSQNGLRNVSDEGRTTSAQPASAGASLNPTRQAGQMGFPDSMPHALNDDGSLVNDRGERVPPMRQNGQAGSNEITWHAGKTVIEQPEPEE